ncbi:MAG: hypothetical protein IKA22_11805, partial [Lentisphaeria bacterium]|nr:hypothetical protein [Lentisphaeria bacterium]
GYCRFFAYAKKLYPKPLHFFIYQLMVYIKHEFLNSFPHLNFISPHNGNRAFQKRKGNCGYIRQTLLCAAEYFSGTNTTAVLGDNHFL